MLCHLLSQYFFWSKISFKTSENLFKVTAKIPLFRLHRSWCCLQRENLSRETRRAWAVNDWICVSIISRIKCWWVSRISATFSHDMWNCANDVENTNILIMRPSRLYGWLEPRISTIRHVRALKSPRSLERSARTTARGVLNRTFQKSGGSRS